MLGKFEECTKNRIYSLVMTDIRTVLADNLKRFRHDRGWSQMKLAEKIGTSPHYIGMMEIKHNFPSSEMIQKLASALGIDPTELFLKEIDPAINREKVFDQVAAVLDDGLRL